MGLWDSALMLLVYALPCCLGPLILLKIGSCLKVPVLFSLLGGALLPVGCLALPIPIP